MFLVSRFGIVSLVLGCLGLGYLSKVLLIFELVLLFATSSHPYSSLNLLFISHYLRCIKAIFLSLLLASRCDLTFLAYQPQFILASLEYFLSLAVFQKNTGQLLLSALGLAEDLTEFVLYATPNCCSVVCTTLIPI